MTRDGGGGGSRRDRQAGRQRWGSWARRSSSLAPGSIAGSRMKIRPRIKVMTLAGRLKWIAGARLPRSHFRRRAKISYIPSPQRVPLYSSYARGFSGFLQDTPLSLWRDVLLRVCESPSSTARGQRPERHKYMSVRYAYGNPACWRFMSPLSSVACFLLCLPLASSTGRPVGLLAPSECQRKRKETVRCATVGHDGRRDR